MKVDSRGGKSRKWVYAVLVVSLLLLLVVGVSGKVGSLCEREEDDLAAMAGGLMGGPKDVKNVENSLEIEELGRFAVQEHNAKEGKNLTFKKVISAKEQVVSGTMYHLTLEATHEAATKVFNAKVWHKPWEGHKSLEHFQEAGSSHSVSSDTQDTSGLRNISVEDPVITEAAEHALKSLNQMSNSLVPYELKDILSAQAKVLDEATEFELHIKVAKGVKEEICKAGLHRTVEGKWTVKTSGLV